jgi:hypothetical protein
VKVYVRFGSLADIAVQSITAVASRRLRNGQAERFCGLEIDDQFNFRQ